MRQMRSGKEVSTIDNAKLLRYSMQLSMLKQLRSKGLISKDEYSRILFVLKKDYGIISHIST